MDTFHHENWLNPSTLERLNGSFLAHSVLQLHATQHTVGLTVKGKFLIGILRENLL